MFLTPSQLFVLFLLPWQAHGKSGSVRIGYTNRTVSVANVLQGSSATRELQVAAAYAGNNGGSAFPLKLCELDCDNDRDCEGNLVCFQRKGNEDVPGCDGLRGFDGRDVCYDGGGSGSETLANVGDNGKPNGVYPLQNCQGDCDNNSDCAGNLVCFQRGSSVDSVPGCIGNPQGSVDYCHYPTETSSNNDGTLEQVGNNGSPSRSFPLARCKGDCDNDRDCAGDLKCYQRGNSDGPDVPGCRGRATGSTDFCYDPDDGPPPQQSAPTRGRLDHTVGFNHQERGVFPIDVCEGDCDADFDCKNELICHQRDRGAPVPGCSGSPSGEIDYCIRPEDDTDLPPIPGAFRLKLYWERGFNWQEQFWEEEYCMRCPGGSCTGGEHMFIATCNKDSTWFVIADENNKGEALIQIADTNQCLQTEGGTQIRIRRCDSSNRRQKFTAGSDSFKDRKFELRSVEYKGCLSQDHHPKPDEEIFEISCESARIDDTSYWNKY